MAGGLGILAGMAGGGGAGAPAPNADDLLAQIQDLLQQYLALGPDTPVAAEAQGLMQAISSQTGAGDAAGGPDAAGPADPSGSLTAMTPEPGASSEAVDPGKYSDPIRAQRDNAKAFLKDKNKKAKA